MALQSRRGFLGTSAGIAAASVAARSGLAETTSGGTPRGKAEHCIMIWLGGGPAQIDTFDPKRKSKDGQKDPGSAYEAIDTAVPGVQLCEHLALTAPLMDRCVPVRTVHHDVIDEHAAAAYRMHTGRATSGTVVYPSLGSLISATKEPLSDLLPSYVLMGNPSPAREPGFLGARHGYVYLTETRSGPKGLIRPERISAERQERRLALMRKLREPYVAQHQAEVIHDYVEAMQQGFRLAGPEFMSVFDLDREPADLRNAFGDEFGQRCLLARRLLERGSRFVEVSHNLNFKNGTGWDTHNEGQKGQHILIQDLDRAFSTLLTDLEEKRLLDKTVILIAGEFGRPAQFDGGGGRGHHGEAFSVLLAGGGMRTGQAVGVTDDLAMKIVDRPVGVPDLFATILAAMGVDPHEELYAENRPVPVTDGGVPIAELFA
jgi:hypothetical protein